MFRPIDIAKQVTSVACGKEHALLLTSLGAVHSLGSGRYIFYQALFLLIIRSREFLSSKLCNKLIMNVKISVTGESKQPCYAYAAYNAEVDIS